MPRYNAAGKARLFRGFRHHRWHAGQPSIEKLLQPGALADIVDRAAGEMLVARASSRQCEPRIAARRPAMQHRVGYVGMKLETKRMARLERLHREVASFCEQFSATWKFKSFAVPVVDMIRPMPAEPEPRGRGADRIVPDLRAALRMRRDPGAELHGEHLRAQTDS